jgi:predicted HicB family RNase H-like nuclease
MANVTSLKKPTLDAARSFAERAPAKGEKRSAGKSKASGQVPEGDVRLTVNIREDLHQRLKIRAVEERTTVGELIEEWIESWR